MGMVITAMIQSSFAATVISISLVRAGLMSLEDSVKLFDRIVMGRTP